jgi:hypothetical protein
MALKFSHARGPVSLIIAGEDRPVQSAKAK